MRKDDWVLYNKVQVESRVPKLEKDLEEARLKWAELSKERTAWVVDVKKVQKVEVDVAEIEKNIF